MDPDIVNNNKLRIENNCTYLNVFFPTAFFTKGNNYFLLWMRNPSKKGSTLEGKNFLPEEQILSFLRRKAKNKMT